MEDTEAYYYRYGAWNETRRARLSEAAAAWRNNTDYDPQIMGSAPAPVGEEHYIYQNTTIEPYCGSYFGAAARTCTRRSDWNGRFYRLYDVDIYINNLEGNGLNWEHSDTHNGIKSYWDFEGVLTHELGHGAYLPDLCSYLDCDPPKACTYTSTAMHTMCQGEPNTFPYPGSFRYRSLTSSDIRDANRLYP